MFDSVILDNLSSHKSPRAAELLKAKGAWFLFGLPALIFAVHTYYLPLDLIYDRVAEKIGDML